MAAFGNGEPGGDFHFRFNYLPGDVNHDAITNPGDWLAVRSLGFRIPGKDDYWYDVDANNAINPGDWLAIRNLGFVQISHLAELSVPGSSSCSGAELSWDEPFWGTGGDQ